MRAELNREIHVRVRVENEAGVLTDLSSGVPTLVVTNGDGTVVTGVSAVTHDSTGVYVAVIPAQTVLDRLTVTWTFTLATYARTVTDRVCLVNERLVPFWRLAENTELTSPTVTTLSRLADGLEEWFKDALKYPPTIEAARLSWVQQFETQRLHVPGVSKPQSILALSHGRGASLYTYTAGDIADLSVVIDGFERNSGTSLSFLQGNFPATFAAGPYAAWLTHGLVDPPEDLRRAATIFARYIARTSNYPERAARVVSQESEIIFSFPSADKPTGLPEVDAVLTRYRIPFFG